MGWDQAEIGMAGLAQLGKGDKKEVRRLQNEAKKTFKEKQKIVVCLSGRGDKDMGIIGPGEKL